MGTEGVEIQVGGRRVNSPRAVALVDDADAEAVGAYRWHMHDGYARWETRAGGKRQLVRMHRFILGLGPNDPDVDHVNGNKLDNRRDNLRIATIAQNNQNLHHRPHRGATWIAEKGRWRAQAMLDRKYRYLGLYNTQEEAVVVAAAFRRANMPYSKEARTHES